MSASGRKARPGPGLRRNASLIARREYRDRVWTRTFVAATAILAVVAVGLALAPIGLRYLDRGTIARIGVVAEAEPGLVGSTIARLDEYSAKQESHR
jgi:ABC-type Na+ efflux pump permease subunit